MCKEVRLNELDKDEMWDLSRLLNPTYSREQFEKDWVEFVTLKAAHEKAKQLN